VEKADTAGCIHGHRLKHRHRQNLDAYMGLDWKWTDIEPYKMSLIHRAITKLRKSLMFMLILSQGLCANESENAVT